MKRSIFDLLRRGFDNTLANWQATLLRFIEMILLFVLMIGGFIAIASPFLISSGIDAGSFDTPEELEGLASLLLTKWMLVLWVILGATALLTLWLVIHSFIDAGSTSIYVDGDRAAGPHVNGPRARYRVFTFDRWWAGAKEGWWTIFWIYNIVWAVVLLVLLIPMGATAIGMFLLRGFEGGLVVVGCLGLAVTMMLMILVMIVGAVWGNRAVVDWAVRRTGAIASVEAAWGEIKADPARHVLSALMIFVVSLAGGAFFGSFSFMAGLTEALGGENKMFVFVTIPMRLVITVLNYAFSSAITSWFVATYVAIGTDPRR